MLSNSPTDENADPAGGLHDASRLSDVLTRIANDPKRDRIAVGDFLRAMQERAFGPLMLIFALPNVLPTPPGTSSVLGAPLVFLAAQLALGRSPWLPPIIARRSIARKDFAAFVGKATPWLAKAERLLQPRLGALAHPPAEYIVGLVCFVLSVVLVLPIPLGNMLPALAICIMALGILERDGIWILVGMAIALTSLGVVSGVVWAFVKASLFVIHSVLG
ncbi:Exopolysaccharide synthesis ExoD [Ancylobacter novellus DSM 506]|uniref:Exopolysaccharide synthesis ExoD n=1 Tax=Ancylobacter novellus (strain ATCC 8093 / DSM 506 / JCM 20403 / CCM 1077 / IAM 12100 / NBRC 12443 / NCIMB 10456) TaxID=639283 RepID=D7A3M7_ANCN5|nr:exopolysaccharide biosynthesis protein [Ancylobacter novellus]ADH91654.1 Exopolysaccharide synthesis ExoD [Ancylobacter novellus DSM 506]